MAVKYHLFAGFFQFQSKPQQFGIMKMIDVTIQLLCLQKNCFCKLCHTGQLTCRHLTDADHVNAVFFFAVVLRYQIRIIAVGCQRRAFFDKDSDIVALMCAGKMTNSHRVYSLSTSINHVLHVFQKISFDLWIPQLNNKSRIESPPTNSLLFI